MPWINVTVTLHPNKDDVGTASCEDEATGYVYSRASKISGPAAAQFKADAEAALAANTAKVAKEATLAATLEGILNG